MLFSSFSFFIFLAFVLLFYFSTNNMKLKNLIVLISSYLYYATWDWRFTILLLISTAFNYAVALLIERYRDTSNSISKAKFVLVTGLVFNIGALCFFKYFNFFTENAYQLLSVLHIQQAKPIWQPMNIIAPLGISFITFQKISYIVDVYKKDVKALKNFLDFAVYPAFFPQLLSGPIERAKIFIPQINSSRILSSREIEEGIWLIFWGLYKKVVIADNLSLIVARVFENNPHEQTGINIVIAMYAFAIQVYCDFSGYTDMAIGMARLFGFKLSMNFNLPYLAQNPSDYWRRWHISLSTFLRDYVYIPLGGSRFGSFATYRNLIITMLLCGLWHGASWLFILFGLYHGVWLSFHRAIKDKLKFLDGTFFTPIKMFITFNAVCFGYIFFRAKSMEQYKIFIHNLLFKFQLNSMTWLTVRSFLIFSTFLIIVQIYQYRTNNLAFFLNARRSVKVSIAVFIFSSLLLFSNGVKDFIYYQF